MDLLELVARNTRRFREERGLSLGGLAERADISKQTLSLIERGMANPTVSTINALATGLDITPRMLLSEWGSAVRLMRAADREATLVGPAAYTPLDQIYGYGWVVTSTVELHRDGGVARHRAEAPGALHQVYVIRGRAQIGPTGQTLTVAAGDFVRFPADVPHEYAAVDESCTLHVTSTTPHVTQLASGAIGPNPT